MLFSLFLSLLGLYICLLDLSFGFFNLIFKLLGFIQFLPKGSHLFPRSSQLIISIAQALPLILSLSLHALQSRISTPPDFFLLNQLIS